MVNFYIAPDPAHSLKNPAEAERITFTPAGKEPNLRVLMLGNSFTFYNNMPKMLSELTGAEVVEHVKGGALLREHLDPSNPLCQMTMKALENEKWDYVIMQELSTAAILENAQFNEAVSVLTEKIRENGAVPVFYATWAYKRDGCMLKMCGMDYDRMYKKMHMAFEETAKKNDLLIADVGTIFYERADDEELFMDDDHHPNEVGSMIAARALAGVLKG